MVVGYVETHGRKETEALVNGLKVLPRRQIEYRGVTLDRNGSGCHPGPPPQLVLVDELAHTNAPGLRHPKRYQDVEEMLDAGINVYTTVNIQHLESLKDVVQQITGIVVRETVPDRIIDEAYEIELVDLPTDELLQRLKEGKVYIPDQAARAVEKFFRKGNLTALREIQPARAADGWTTRCCAYMQPNPSPVPGRPANGSWCASARTRWVSDWSAPGRRLADDLNAEWYVVYVETPTCMPVSASEMERVNHNLQLAEELGAK